MSIDEPDKIDIVTRSADGTVCLVLTDHLPWGDPEHLLKLQEKLNAYIAFYESGQIRDVEPAAVNGRVVVEVVSKYTPDDEAQAFLFKVGELVAPIGLAVRWREVEA